MRTSKWTEPQIFPKKPKSNDDLKKDWRVWFRFFHSGKWHMISRKSAGVALRDIPDLKERLLFAKEIQKELRNRLLRGWNPIDNSYTVKTLAEVQIEEFKLMEFPQALDFVFRKKENQWSPKTRQDYSSAIKYLKAAAGSLHIYKKIGEFKRVDFKLILEETYKSRRLDEKGFNRYREFLSCLVGELVEWDILETNYIRDIKKKAVSYSFAHRPPTQDERILIVNRIKNFHRNYFRFIAVLYGCTIRPKEITRIKIKYLHKMEGVFRLPKEITKTRQEREVPVPGWLMDLLSELNLHNLDPEWYLFSTHNRYSSFLPGPNQMHVSSSTGWWHKIVKASVEKGGLGLNVNQYSLKKLSGNDMVKLQRREGVNNLLELPRTMMGHSSNKMTEIYVDEHKKIINELIRDKMPEL
jgi:integrase/recombinase XerD